ncbi:bromodomain-containing protein [Fusarium heterosporum]|uniref:pectin lyase n=1 Tax=Fusarium heterosporum TaxID=42747 RepID=A0A8H5TCN0_FUSHE|nr:bromodomain-containing protein [Fusarium heterosporum]
MRLQSLAALLAAAATASAQSVSGKAYGFAAGVTGGEGEAVTPATAEELAELLADDTPRVIYIDKEFDFTGDVKTGAGCDRKSCSASNGGQLYLGDLSCGGEDNVAVSSITYDAAGTEPLPVGSNKSVIGNGKAVLNGKGLSIKKGSTNVIIQGIEITNLNPGVVWGGDALELKGLNDGVWIDHCKFSKVGRMFIVSHYDGSRLTISNSEFDGVTDTSASCNGNHYWTMMFYGEGDQVTLDRNHFHDVAGRAPKLGEPGTNGYFHATNNYFQNMKGHAFDAYQGANAIIEGNVFDGVDTPVTKEGASVNTLFIPDESAAAACQSVLGRACEPNSATSSGDLPIMSGESGLNAVAKHKDNIITPVAASEVAALVLSDAGPANVGSGTVSDSAPAGDSDSDEDATKTTPATPENTPQTTPDTVTEATTPQTTPEATPEQEQNLTETDYDEQVEPISEAETTPATTDDCEETTESATPVVEAPASQDDCDSEDTPEASSSESSSSATPSGDSSSSGSSSVQMYGQCGGANFTGSTKCASGSTCKKMNEYYSQCIGSNSRIRRYVQV